MSFARSNSYNNSNNGNALFQSFKGFVAQDEIARLRAACEETFTAKAKKDSAYSTGTTFWIGADDTPLNELEAYALRVFEFTTQGETFDRSQSGAEFWPLVLDLVDADVGPHYDKDYGSEPENIYPRWGTVTYLSVLGAPTVFFDQTEDQELPAGITRGYLSKPVPGKHVKFDGRLLHCASSSLFDPTTADSTVPTGNAAAFSPKKRGGSHLKKSPDKIPEKGNEGAATIPNEGTGGPSSADTDDAEAKKKEKEKEKKAKKPKPKKRITLLVNVWLNHKPVDAKRIKAPEDAKEFKVEPVFVTSEKLEKLELTEENEKIKMRIDKRRVVEFRAPSLRQLSSVSSIELVWKEGCAGVKIKKQEKGGKKKNSKKNGKGDRKEK